MTLAQNLLLKDKRNVYYLIELMCIDANGEDVTGVLVFGRVISSTPIIRNKLLYEDFQKWFDTLTLVSSDICFDKDTNSIALGQKAISEHKGITKFHFIYDNIPLPTLPSDNKIVRDIKGSILSSIGIRKDGYLRDYL